MRKLAWETLLFPQRIQSPQVFRSAHELRAMKSEIALAVVPDGFERITKRMNMPAMAATSPDNTYSPVTTNPIYSLF